VLHSLQKRLLWTATGAAVLLLSPAAAADTVALMTVGFVYSHGWGDTTVDGLGAEASVSIYPVDNGVNFGFFAQGQGYNAAAGASLTQEAQEGGLFGRTAVGTQLAWGGFGMEMGWAYVSDVSGLPAYHGLHIAHFLSAGILMVAPRFTIPVGSERATEFALTVGLKLPILLAGDGAAKFPAAVFVGGGGGEE
jgi:hypothetical protein